ncbi:MAG: hypothetical protein ABJM39_06900 [Porticoccus sp.]|jgi:hypothetical protein|uniref:hypothetical protein n=1 Tax=Porticoccus sp. TaxID=2024853 RepID=UPI0032974B15
MKCPSCSAQFEFSKAVNPKRGALKIICECPECGDKLSNNPSMETLRVVSIFVTLFGFLSFGGSWPFPQLPIAASGAITVVGIAITIYAFKNSKFIAQQ